MDTIADKNTVQPEAAEPRKKIKLPPYRGVEAYAPAHLKPHPGWIRITLLAVGVLGTMAVMADMMQAAKVKSLAPKQQSPTEILMSISRATNRYMDPDHRFSVAVPDGWRWERKKSDEDYDVTFYGPERIEVAMLAIYAPGKTLDELKKEFEETEQDQRIISHIETTTFKGHPAIQRFCRLKLLSFQSLDVLAHGTAYHLMASVSTDHYAELKPVVTAFADTFEPIAPVAASP